MQYKPKGFHSKILSNTPSHQGFHLACLAGPVLDGRPPRPARAAPQRQVCTVRPDHRGHAPLVHLLPLLPPNLARGPFLVLSTATIPSPDTPFADWWIDTCTSSPMVLRKGLSSIIALTAWAIWKHRNGCVFDQRQPSVTSLLQSIREDARLWASAGANGLANLIPET